MDKCVADDDRTLSEDEDKDNDASDDNTDESISDVTAEIESDFDSDYEDEGEEAIIVNDDEYDGGGNESHLSIAWWEQGEAPATTL
eukprot:8249940-Ditylum_brightwellii.AAC.1